MRSFYARLEGMHLCLLAPERERIPGSFINVSEDARRHGALLDEVQRLRGGVYVQDSALPGGALDKHGRHRDPVDASCWHMALLDGHGNVRAAIRMAIHFAGQEEVTLANLQAAHLVRRMPSPMRQKFVVALTDFIGDAARSTACFFETGGWVLDEAVRRHAAAPVTVAAVYALARALGGARGIGAATTRHGSASVLKRFGGFEVLCGKNETLKPFHDPYYGCEMEILGFVSDRLSPSCETTVTDIQRALATIPVFTR